MQSFIKTKKKGLYLWLFSTGLKRQLCDISHGNIFSATSGATWNYLSRDHRCGIGVTSLPLTQRAPVRSPVGSVFLVEVFLGFSSTVRYMSGKLRPHPSPDITGHYNHQKSFITGANDLWCCRALKPHNLHSIQFKIQNKEVYKILKGYTIWK